MRWQRAAQVTILIGVIAVVVGIVVSLRTSKTNDAQASVPAPPPEAGTELFNPKGATLTRMDGGRKVFEAVLGPHTTYPDGRVAVKGGVRILTNRNGKDLVIQSAEADIRQKDEGLESAVFRQDVGLTTADGLDVKAAEATYVEAEGIVRIPGAVEFRKGRMSGGGVGATYDSNREVLWILDQARISVAPEADGRGALEGSAATAGFARPEHYAKLSKDARITGDGREMQGDEITIVLTPDDKRVQMIQLRGNSSITGGAGGPQSMAARDIDVAYGADGSTLQSARLIEQSAVTLGGAAAGKRISARTTHIGMSPDGSTVTHLASNENVQVDIPPEGNSPARQISSATLVSDGPPGSGLQTATFTGKVEFRETQAARGGAPAIDRTARSETLVIETGPGLGTIQKADFRGSVRFVDAPDLTAEAPRGIYHIGRDRIELMPADGVPGPPPLINNGKISVAARTLDFTLGSRELNADTRVRSTILAKKERTARGQQQARVPSVLKQDEPVNVTSNKLSYRSSASTATYSGNVKLWQGSETTIKADQIVLDDKTGNLSATGHVVTEFYLDETNEKTGQRKRSQTIGKSETFAYDEARRMATYTTKAHINGPQGDITASRIELLLKPAGSNELERAEAYASGSEPVVVKDGLRTARGAHLTYTAADDQYLMIGTPVTTVEETTNGMCRVGTGSSLRFFRGVEQGQMDGNRLTPSRTETLPCASVGR